MLAIARVERIADFVQRRYELVDAILSEFCQDILQHYKDITSTEASAVERLRMLTRYAFSLVEERPYALVMFYNEGRQLVATETRFLDGGISRDAGVSRVNAYHVL